MGKAATCSTRDMGGPDVEAFLTMLATDRHVSASTHNHALSALLFSTASCSGLTCQGSLV
jgi:hypothetical protein